MRVRVVGARYLPARVSVAMLTAGAEAVGDRLGVGRVTIHIRPHASACMGACEVEGRRRPIVVLYPKAIATESGRPVTLYARTLTHELVHYAQALRPASGAWFTDDLTEREALALERIYYPTAERAMRA